MTPSPAPPDDRIIRVSLGLLVIGAAAVVGLGFLGALLAEQLLGTELPPLTDGTDRLVTTVQQVTISPNTAAAEAIRRVQPSVLLLSHAGDTPQVIGTAFVVTSDGLLVTTVPLGSGDVVGYDADGRSIGLERVGTDELFGLTYLRLVDAVITPLDVEQSDPSEGTTLLALGRNPDTFQPRTAPFRVQQYTLPDASQPVAVQRVLTTAGAADTALAGSPLLDEAGRVVGVLQASGTRALPASHLQASLQRLATERERNPLAELGLTLRYRFAAVTPDAAVQFVAEVVGVTPGTPAAAAGITRGDQIVAVQDAALSWAQPAVTLLGRSLPLPVTIARNGETRIVTLSPVPSPTP